MDQEWALADQQLWHILAEVIQWMDLAGFTKWKGLAVVPANAFWACKEWVGLATVH